jgi:hypothetical protein
MEENPYQSPAEQSEHSPVGEGRRPLWLVWIATGWIVFIFFLFPLINVSRRPSPGSYLNFKVVTTAISLLAAIALIGIPRGWWKLCGVLLTGILAIIQVRAWMVLP